MVAEPFPFVLGEDGGMVDQRQKRRALIEELEALSASEEAEVFELYLTVDEEGRYEGEVHGNEAGIRRLGLALLRAAEAESDEDRANAFAKVIEVSSVKFHHVANREEYEGPASGPTARTWGDRSREGCFTVGCSVAVVLFFFVLYLGLERAFGLLAGR